MKRETIAVLAFPTVLTVGILLIPVVSDYADREIQEKAASQTFRWVWGHLVAAVGFGMGVMAAGTVAERVVALTRRSIWWISVVLIAIGAALHAAGLGADGVGPIASLSAGRSAAEFFDGSASVVPPIFIAGAAFFSFGQIGLVLGARQANIVSGRDGFLALAAAILFGGAEAIPSGWGLYVVAFLSWMIWLPIATGIGRSETA